VKRPRPGESVGQDPGAGSQRLCADALDAPRHLGRRPAGERHQQDATRIGAVDDQMGDTMGERVGLACPGPGDDEERPARRTPLFPDAMFDSLPLFGVEFFEVGHARRSRTGGRAGG
jgi:hypothetical protein